MALRPGAKVCARVDGLRHSRGETGFLVERRHGGDWLVRFRRGETVLTCGSEFVLI